MDFDYAYCQEQKKITMQIRKLENYDADGIR